MHGFRLNADYDLGWAQQIVPCGIADAGSPASAARLDRDVTVQEILPLAERHLARVFDMTTDEASEAARARGAVQGTTPLPVGLLDRAARTARAGRP